MLTPNWKAGMDKHPEEHNLITRRINNIIYADAYGTSTTNIQQALDAGAGKAVYFPAGVYSIDAAVGLWPRPNTIIEFAPGAELKVIPNDRDGYYLFYLNNVTNVVFRGGLLTGDRYQHTGATGEWGHGVVIKGGANIRLEGVTCRDFWGDGVYITKGAAVPERVSLTDCVMNNNRRQGMSIISARYLMATRCAFAQSNGTAPEAGVDLEPNLPGEIIQHVHFADCLFKGNQIGLLLYGINERVSFVRANGCVFENNAATSVRAITADHLHLIGCDSDNAYDTDRAANVMATDCTP